MWCRWCHTDVSVLTGVSGLLCLYSVTNQTHPHRGPSLTFHFADQREGPGGRGQGHAHGTGRRHQEENLGRVLNGGKLRGDTHSLTHSPSYAHVVIDTNSNIFTK